MGGWIEKGGRRPPRAARLAGRRREWEMGAGMRKHLKNLYVYFWRWATLKVFGSGRFAATGQPDTDEEGIVCFITVAGFLNGPGFEKMRDDLRRTCSDIWVIDCSPEGHQPDVPTRIFQGVQQPVCIVLAARPLGKDEKTPAHIRFRALPNGRREEKFKALAALSLDCRDLDRLSRGLARAVSCRNSAGTWADFAPSASPYSRIATPVVIPASDVADLRQTRRSLRRRWDSLIAEKRP